MKMKEEYTYWEKITAWFSNEISLDQKKEIEIWADEQDGKELLMDIKTKMDQIDKVEFMHDAQTEAAWNKLNIRIQEEKVVTKKRVVFKPTYLFAAAASLLILLSIGYGLFKLSVSNPQLELTQTAYNQSQVELPDGSIVYLNGNSSLTYPTEFNDKERHVKLSGEAYFEVQPDAAHPFIIQTENAFIKVLGTSFNVKTDALQKNVEVLVSSGKVKVEEISDPSKNRVLVKGEFASLQNQVFRNQLPTDINYLAWKTKLIEFRNTPMSEVVRTLNRAYAVQIKLESEALENYKLTSKYDQIEVNALLKAICLTFDLKQKVDGDQIVLYASTP